MKFVSALKRAFIGLFETINIFFNFFETRTLRENSTKFKTDLSVYTIKTQYSKILTQYAAMKRSLFN